VRARLKNHRDALFVALLGLQRAFSRQKAADAEPIVRSLAPTERASRADGDGASEGNGDDREEREGNSDEKGKRVYNGGHVRRAEADSHFGGRIRIQPS